MSTITDQLKQVGFGAVVVLLGSVLGQGISLLAQVFIARNLGPDLFGQIALGLTIATIAAQLSAVGIPEGITRQIASVEDHQTKREIISSGVIILLLSSVAGSLIIFGFKGEISELLGKPSLPHVLTLFFLLVLFQPLSHVPVSILRSEKESTRATILRDIVSKAVAALCVIITFSLGYQYIGSIFFWVIQPIVIVVLAPIFLRGIEYKTHFKLPSKEAIEDLFSFSWPLAIETGFLLMMSNLDILMIGYFLASADVGFYRAVQPIAFALGLVLSSSVFIYLPTATELFSDSDFKDLNDLFKLVTKWSTIVTIPVASVFIFESDTVVSLLFTEQYIAASLPLSILSVGMLLRVIVGPNGATIKAIGETQIDLYATGMASVANVLLNYILIPRFGIQGAAVATSVSFLIYNLIELVVIYKSVSIQPFSFGLIKMSMILLFTGQILSYIITLDGWPRLILFTVLMFIAVPISLVLTKSLNTEEYELISSVREDFL